MPHLSTSLGSVSDDSSSAGFDLAKALVRRRGLFATPQRKLVAALVASLVAHFAISAFVTVEANEEKFQPIVAKLMALPPPPVAVPVAKPTPKPKAKPKANRPPIVTAESPVAVAAPEPAVEVASTAAPESTAPAAPPPEPEPAPVAQAAPEPAPPAPAPPEPPARMPPKKIELGYTAFFGEQKFEVGPIALKFEHDNGRYKLRIVGRGKGIAALLYPGTFTGESEGRITADGLRPDKFTEERGNPDKRRETIFDHEKGLLRIPEKDPIPFEGSAQDPLTWIVQFYFAMPKGDTVTFSVGSSRRMDVYTLVREGDEEIDVPTGDADPLTGLRATKKVMTQVWKGSRKPDPDGKPQGSAQFWLAPEWHYVPFRLKVVSPQGRSASFDLTGISAE